MKYYSIDEATKLLTQFDITYSKQMVNRWVRDSIIIAEKIDRKYMISEENLISFIEEKKPKMIQLIAETIEISERMEHLLEKLTAIEVKISELIANQEGLNEIKQLLSTIQENTHKKKNLRKPPKPTVQKKEEDNSIQLAMENIMDNPSVNSVDEILQGDKDEHPIEVKKDIDELVQEDKESHQTNDVNTDNEVLLEENKEEHLVDVKNNMGEFIKENKENFQFSEVKQGDDQKINMTDQIGEDFPFTDDQIKMAMGKAIDARTFSQHEKDIFDKIKTTLLDDIDKWYLPTEKQCYKCLYSKKQFASGLPFLKSTSLHISKKWKIDQ